MLKFVTNSKKFMMQVQQVPILRNFFVFDYSALNEIQDQDFYNLVFSHIIVSNGLTKTTKSERFKDLDAITLQLMSKDQSVLVHDTGVSNGVTSLEFYRQLLSGNRQMEYYISDKYAKIYYEGSGVKRFYDADGKMISVNFGIFHFSPRIGKAFFLSRWLFCFFKKTVDLKAKAYREIILLSPEVYALAKENKIHLVDFDVFTTILGKPFNFLRCMNVLMPAYFTINQIQAGVRNLHANLAEGGLLLLGRTDAENINHASFYVRTDSSLKVLQEVNGGFDYNNPK